MCVATALIRGLSQYRSEQIGNFWVNLVRTVLRILVPLSMVVTLILLALGVVNNFHAAQDITTIAGRHQTILGGPVATWESIKLISGDGGGAFNANSAHPFENPTPLTNVVEIVAMLLIPVAFIRTFGVMVGDKKQGWVLFAAAAILFVIGTAALAASDVVANGTVIHAVGAPTEGTEIRFGVPGSAVFGQAATASADGAANSAYDSYTSAGGAVLMLNVMLGEVAPGGPDSGLYGLLMMTLLAVFLGGLMIERTPEYLKQRLRSRHMTLISIYILTLPAAVLTGAAVAMALPGGTRRHAQHRAPRALRSAVRIHQCRGQQRQCLRRNFRQHYVVQHRARPRDGGRTVPADHRRARDRRNLRGQRAGVITAGTLRTHSPTFVFLIAGATLVIVGLEYLPALAFGPAVDALVR